jgi:hypothetical protein
VSVPGVARQGELPRGDDRQEPPDRSVFRTIAAGEKRTQMSDVVTPTRPGAANIAPMLKRPREAKKVIANSVLRMEFRSFVQRTKPFSDGSHRRVGPCSER